MYKYVVSWVLITTFQVTTPPIKDEFGRELIIISAMLHTQSLGTPKKKEFLVRRKAFDFYHRAKKQESNVMSYHLGGAIDSVKIDSIKLK